MKFPIFNLVLTVFLLWLTIQLDSSFEIYLAYFFILTVGIVHGANDISLIKYISKDSDASQIKYLSFYIGVIILMSVAFFQLPFLALCVFIVFSCYHFGEQHFYSQLKDAHFKTILLYISYGALIFGLLFYLNIEATTSIITELTGIEIPKMYFVIFLIISSIMTVLMVASNYKNFKEGVEFFNEIFLIALFIVLFKLASLLWAFAIYFIIWHSIPSLKDQTLALYGQLDKTSFLKYFKSSVINWVISIVGLGLIYYLSTLMDIRFITLFFAFLAAITIPHVVVMYFLNKK
ncbi:Brp/Blh family beta-carotene 15,15'-dioxygenase [Winogradskyella sp. DF17]|uniref:Probable beta-carotene 15,15'-dioxygenase n=1 Tax=Winogradskyella pelagia TaxID=2819984 RepID=A0ABS3T3T0_9FLAO|nr:Brp/Blh family beta-carotene 15,15'-dioxygenase [Winogradskyella sp. DF17]MBO3116531.1 Brp/Blh family beta-carotene 15,15'-dioxygenase [Winogradskyella sp. DF17]